MLSNLLTPKPPGLSYCPIPMETLYRYHNRVAGRPFHGCAANSRLELQIFMESLLPDPSLSKKWAHAKPGSRKELGLACSSNPSSPIIARRHSFTEPRFLPACEARPASREAWQASRRPPKRTFETASVSQMMHVVHHMHAVVPRAAMVPRATRSTTSDSSTVRVVHRDVGSVGGNSS